MAEIRYIKDDKQGIILPVTHERGVIDSTGVTLETKLSQKQPNLVSGVNIKTINNESLLGPGDIELIADTSSCEQLVNKVTTITSSSTNAQYPSAKGVYDYVYNSMASVYSYPVFEIDSDMHLTMSSLDEVPLSLFSVNQDGHLLITINN